MSMLRLSARRLGGVGGRGFSPGPTAYSITKCKMYSDPVQTNSKWTTAWARARAPVFCKQPADPAHYDYYFEKWMQKWIMECPAFSYIWVSVMAWAIAMCHLFRQLSANPDVTFRKQERHKPIADRHRQFSYALPFFNHRMRNLMIKYKWNMIDNEPDYADNYEPGYRPDRVQAHRRPPFYAITRTKYIVDDPMYTACSTKNIEKIYADLGYKKSNVSHDNR